MVLVARLWLLLLSLVQGAAVPVPDASIRVVRVDYACVDGEYAQARVLMSVELANRGAKALVVPRRWLQVGRQRYAASERDLDGEAAIKLDGVLRLTAGRPGPAKADDFVRVGRGETHRVDIEHSVAVSAKGVAIPGLLVPREYVAAYDVEPFFPVDPQDATWQRLKSGLDPLWTDAVWSRPFRLTLPPVPERLPACAVTG